MRIINICWAQNNKDYYQKHKAGDVGESGPLSYITPAASISIKVHSLVQNRCSVSCKPLSYWTFECCLFGFNYNRASAIRNVCRMKFTLVISLLAVFFKKFWKFLYSICYTLGKYIEKYIKLYIYEHIIFIIMQTKSTIFLPSGKRGSNWFNVQAFFMGVGVRNLQLQICSPDFIWII